MGDTEKDNVTTNGEEDDGVKKDVVDSGGRRLGIDRRQVDIPFEGPDRRSGKERRTGKDRRKEWSRQPDDKERRSKYHIK
jgi:hypothetical protein